MKRLAFAVAVLVAGLIGTELLARCLGEDVIRHPYRYDSVLGWVNSPNQETEYVPPPEAARATGWKIVTDDDGCRVSPGGRKDRGPGATVLAIGDSFTIAHQVPYEATFGALLERTMREEGMALNVRVCGVSDYGTFQELLLTERLLETETPAAILLQVFAYNDLLNDSILAAGAGAQDLYRPYRRQADVLDGVTRKVRAWSKAYRMAESIVLGSIFPRVGWVDPRSTSGTDAALESLRHQLPVRSPSEPVWQVLFGPYLDPPRQPPYAREGWISIAEDLEGFRDLARRNAIPLIVVLIPHEHELRWRERDQLERLGYRANRMAAEAKLTALLERLDIRHVRLIDDFDAHQSDVIPYWGGHLNERAHRLVAEAVAGPLAEALARP